MGNPNILYSTQKKQIETASGAFGIFIIIAIVVIALIIYFYGDKNGWWQNKSEKEYGIDLSNPPRDMCGMISMECGIDESSNRYRFHSGRFNIEEDPMWKSPTVNGTGKTTILCNPETFECSPNINGCAPALNCDNKTCGIEKQSIINNIYENAQGDYTSPSANYNRFNGRPLYNSQWNTMAEEQYFGFNCIDSEVGPINTDWFNRCLLLLEEENYDRYTDTMNNAEDTNNKDPGSEKFKNIKKCETYLNMSYKDTNNANFNLKKNIILREIDNYKKNGVDKTYVDNIKQFKPRSINDILINKQQDIINSFYLNKDIKLSKEEEKSLSNILNTPSSSDKNIKSSSSINQIKSIQSDTIDTDEPMENIWGQSGSTKNSIIETFANNKEEEEEEEEEDNNVELNTTSQSCKIEGPGCDLPKCGWEYTFVAPKEVSIHECTKKLYWSQAGPYGMVPVEGEEPVEDMTLTISSIGSDSNTGAPLELNENDVFPGSRKEGNLDSYSINAQDSRAYNKIPAQFATCEYINNYKYDKNSNKWQFQDDSGNNIDNYPGGKFNPVDGAGKPITDIKDLCNMSASFRANKVINSDTYYNADRLPVGGRGFASDIEAIDRQISNTGSSVVAGCKWYEGNGEIPSQCIQEGMEGLIEQDNSKPLYEKWCILDPGSDLIDLPVYEYPGRDNPDPDWAKDGFVETNMFGGIDPWINPPLKKRDFGSCSGGAGLGLSSQNEPRQGPFCNKEVEGAIVNSDGTVNCPGVGDLEITGVGKWLTPSGPSGPSGSQFQGNIIDSDQGVFDWTPVPVAPLICTNPYKFGSKMGRRNSQFDVCAWDFSSATNNGSWWRSSDNPKMASGIQGSTTGLGSSHCPDPRYPHPVIVEDGNCNCNNCVSCCNKYDSLGWQQEDANSLGGNLRVGIGRDYAAVWANPVSIPQRGGRLKRWEMGDKEGSESWNRDKGQRQLASGVTENTGVAYSRPPYSPWLQSTSSNISCVLEQAGCTDSICDEKNGELLYDTGSICAVNELMGGNDETNYTNWGRVERDDIITSQEGVFTRAIDSPGPSDYGTGDESPTVFLRNFKYPNSAFIESENVS